MKIAVFIITALIQLVAGFISFFMLLLGLNGYSGQQAQPSLIFFIALTLISAPALGAGGAFTTNWLMRKKSFNSFVAAALAVVIFAVIGIAILFAGFFGAAIIAEIVRGMK